MNQNLAVAADRFARNRLSRALKFG